MFVVTCVALPWQIDRTELKMLVGIFFSELCKRCTTTRMFKMDVTHSLKVVLAFNSNVSSNDEATLSGTHVFLVKRSCSGFKSGDGAHLRTEGT